MCIRDSTARERANLGVSGWRAQRIHRLFELIVKIPAVGRVNLLLQRAHLGKQRIEVSIRFSPVSYTHLDVYKRQVLHSELEPGQIRLNEACIYV